MAFGGFPQAWFPLLMVYLKIVPRHSAQLGIGNNEQLFSISGGDHRNMCKFSSSTEPQYRQLSQAMKKLVNDALDLKKAEGIGQEVTQDASSPCKHPHKTRWP
jgi:hypothetical protein